MPTFYKQLIVFCLLSLLILLPALNLAEAEASAGLNLLQSSASTAAGGDIKKDSFSTWTGTLAKTVVGLVGVILAVVIVLGGWKWMFAAGDSTKIAAAKKFILWGIAGLVVVMLAYTITSFVMKKYLTI